MSTFTRRTELPVPADEAFAWHERPGALRRLTPPWHSVEVEQHEGIHDGNRTVLDIGPGPIPIKWVTEHQGYKEGREFTDVQVSGPFSRWRHVHRVMPHDVDTRHSVLEDCVSYGLPLSRISDAVVARRAERELVRMFSYRHRVTREDLVRHAHASLPPLTIAITGSCGFIGQALTAFLTTGGHTVVRVVRSRTEVLQYSRSPQERATFWNPKRGFVDISGLNGVDAVIHLAGEPFIGTRWTRRQMGRIFDSRARGTRLLADTLAALPNPPQVLLSASSTGYYGDREHEMLPEEAEPGSGFLPDVCRAWEAATWPAEEAGIRVCHMRFGAVLSPRGGLLKAALPAFRFGLGGVVGRGKRWIPWIALDDALYAMLHLLCYDAVRGPVNVATQHPVTQRRLADVLSTTLRRPAVLRIPHPVARLAGGDLLHEVILHSARVAPAVLANSGFQFAYPRIDDALQHALGRSAAVPINAHSS
jgi:uncharacterized protein